MTTYQLRLLLEAIIRIHSIEELLDGERVKTLLSKNFLFSEEELDALIEGALELSHLRIKRGQTLVRGEHYLQ